MAATKTKHSVSKEEFYRVMGPLDVHPRIVTGYPYTTHWELNHTRKLIGVSVDTIPANNWPTVTSYYLVEEASHG